MLTIGHPKEQHTNIIMKHMEITAHFNELNGDYWFDLGISCHATIYNKYKYVFTLGFGFFTVYIRWYAV